MSESRESPCADVPLTLQLYPYGNSGRQRVKYLLQSHLEDVIIVLICYRANEKQHICDILHQWSVSRHRCPVLIKKIWFNSCYDVRQEVCDDWSSILESDTIQAVVCKPLTSKE